MIERRREPRSRSLLSGTIHFNDKKSALDCVVKNLSDGGALVVLPPGSLMPREFDLLVPRREEEHHANVVWRRDGRAGLALSPVEDIPMRPGARKKRWLQGAARPARKPMSLGY